MENEMTKLEELTPLEGVEAEQSKGHSTVTLSSISWGGSLVVGDHFGFMTKTGCYKVIETFPLESTKYRISPPLLTDITTEDKATRWFAISENADEAAWWVGKAYEEELSKQHD
jgi:hypothetical protein